MCSKPKLHWRGTPFPRVRSTGPLVRRRVRLLRRYQRLEGLAVSHVLDTNTESDLKLEESMLTDYVVTSNDLARLQPIGKTWLARSQQSALDYETILELVAEKAHCTRRSFKN